MADYASYAIICDYDGTLTRSDNDVHPDNIAAAREFVEAGGTFCLATGKSPREVDPRLLEVASTSVFCGGTVVRDPQRRRTLATWPLPSEALDLVRRLYEELPGCGIGISCEEASYCLRHDPGIVPTEFVERHLLRIGPDVLGSLAGHMLSINTHGSEEVGAAVERIVEEGYPELSHEVSFPRFVDIRPADVSKGTGLDYLRAHVLSDKVFLAAGDNGNDRELLDRADVGFAMRDGADELKCRADVVLGDRSHPCVREMMGWIRQNDPAVLN